MNDEQLERLIAQLKSSSETALSRLNQHLQSLIPTFIEETANKSTAEATTDTLTWHAERDTLFRCTSLMVVLPLNTVSASLSLGSVTFSIPLQNTTVFTAPIQHILSSTDVRKLTYTTGADNGGEAFVWLMGDAVPNYGKM